MQNFLLVKLIGCLNFLNRKKNNPQKPTIVYFKKKQLIDYFESNAKYQAIIQILIQHKVIYEDTLRWADQHRGNKKNVVMLIKELKLKGYFNDSMVVGSKEIKEISWNTFGIDVGIDTIKHTQPDTGLYNYIPYSYTFSTPLKHALYTLYTLITLNADWN